MKLASKLNKFLLIVFSLALALPATTLANKEIRIGVLYDYTGPLAGAGGIPGGDGTQIAIDMINERGGVEGYTIVPVKGDAQSKPDIAISEAERLINVENVDMLIGFYSSAQCVPVSAKVDSMKTFMWMTICISSAVFKDRNLKYAFRPQVHSDQFGQIAPEFLSHYAQERFGKAPQDLRIAIIHEDGPYGSGVAGSNEAAAKSRGMKVVLNEGYSSTAPDLSSMVIKLKRARPDVILHTGYNPDITLFLRQAREQGLRYKALIGHGAGYSDIDKLMGTFGEGVNFTFNVDPVAGQLLDASSLAPGVGDLTKEMLRRYRALRQVEEVRSHVSMGFNHTWILLNDVLPQAIRKYGGYDAEALRKASLDLDIPEGGTIQGYGIKFYPPGHQMAGQNMRSSPVIMQYVDGKTKIAWPKSIQTINPVLPLPKGHPYAAK